MDTNMMNSNSEEKNVSSEAIDASYIEVVVDNDKDKDGDKDDD